MLRFQILLLCEANTVAFSAPFGICSAGGEIVRELWETVQELGSQSHARVVHFRINLDEFWINRPRVLRAVLNKRPCESNKRLARWGSLVLHSFCLVSAETIRNTPVGLSRLFTQPSEIHLSRLNLCTLSTLSTPNIWLRSRLLVSSRRKWPNSKKVRMDRRRSDEAYVALIPTTTMKSTTACSSGVWWTTTNDQGYISQRKCGEWLRCIASKTHGI